MFYQYIPASTLWDGPVSEGLWIAQKIVLLAFWITAAYSSNQVFRERSYSPNYLLGYKT